MIQHPSVDTKFRSVFAISVCVVVALVILRALFAYGPVSELLAGHDNDTVMRFLSVRDWLAGQGWYDMTQYRVLPPEGISLHWSRLLDAAIAGVGWPARLMAGTAAGEVAMLLVWPTLLQLILLAITAIGTRRLLGNLAATVAVLMVFLWGPTSSQHFGPGQIDHHNIQIVLMTLIAFSLVWPTRPLSRGLVAGFAAALSLAIGLEALIFIVVAGLILNMRATFDGAAHNAPLIGFCGSIVVGAFVLFGLQVRPQDWFVPRCDMLSSPFLAVVTVAAAACVLPMILVPARPVLRLALTAGLALVGIALFWSILSPCLAGPYANLPADVQAIIIRDITEALPAHIAIWRYPALFFAVFLPVAAGLGLATIIWFRNALPSPTDTRLAIGIMLVFGWLGLIGSLGQNRTIVMATAALPFLTGYVIARLINRRLRYPSNGATLAIAAALLLTLGAPGLWPPLKSGMAALRGKAITPELTLQGAECRDADVLMALNAVPPGQIMTSMNIGAPLILSTHHAAMAAPYHRSSDALANGVLTFRLGEADLRTYLANTAATHLLVCRANSYGASPSFATKLANGAQTDWLRPVTLANTGDGTGGTPLMLFEIMR